MTNDAKPAGAAMKMFGDIAPDFARLSDDVLFGDVWEQPGLSKRDRSLVTCAILVATGKTDQMTSHFPRAIANGVTRDELIAMITHAAFYSGWPASVSAIGKVRDVLDAKA